MKSNRIRLLAMFGFAVLAIGAWASTTTAQDAFKGSFTLPHEVRWQGRVMPAGDYTFTLKSISVSTIMRLEGPDGATFVSTSGISDSHRNKKSCLTIEYRGGTPFVSDLYLKEFGVHLRYSVPKGSKEELLSQASPTTEYILVASAKQ